MFDLVQRNKRVIQIVLAIILLPFAFFGVDSYFRDKGSGQTLAKVGDYEISEHEFQQALRERQESLRREMSGGRVDPALLESSEVRLSVLDSLVRQRLLLSHALRSGMTVTPEQLRAYITQAPAFQENGQFSLTRYQQMLKGRSETAPNFENRVRQELLLRQLNEIYSDSSFAPRTVAERLMRITEQQREVDRAFISADQIVASVEPEDNAARKSYDSHQDEFRVPEQVRVEYVMLTLESLLPQIQIDPADLKTYYEGHLRDYGAAEQRQASHILIAVDKGASAEAKQKARAQAEQIYNEVTKTPAKFAELASKYSQDPGSAAKGGELGSFGRGSMVKAFDDAVFSMKVGEISQPVESDYGYHIIHVTGITPGETKSFEQVRPEIEKELKKQRAGRKFAEVAESFNNIVFEQSDSLKPAADLLKETTRKSGWITRTGAEDARLNNPKLLQAVFSEDVLANKRNTEAIEVGPGTLVSARVIEHKPAAMQPYEQVKPVVEKKLIQQRANQLAAQEGRQQLEALRQGKDVQLSWDAPQLVSRADPKGLAEPVLRQAFKVDASKLPSYGGIEGPGGGYVLFKISRVVESQKTDNVQQKSLADGLAQIAGEEQFSAYVASLKQKASVKLLNKERLEKSQ